MNVTFDISVLGWGRRQPVGRTGVFRVVEHVARGLARSPDCSLAFCATHSVAVFNEAEAWLRENPELAHVPLVARPRAAGLVRALSRTAERLDGHRPSAKAVRGAARLATRVVERAWRGWAGPGALAGDVFHSPFGPFPEAVRRVPRMRRFLTVYDLIPVLHPEHFDTAGEHHLLPVLRALRPDDWVLAISERTRADLLEFRPELDPARVRVTPLAADPARFHPVDDPERIGRVRARYGIPPGPYLLSLNTLEPRKNLHRLVRAFVRAAGERGVELNLVLVGASGWKTASLLEAIREAGPLRERIVLPGYVADEDLAALYSGATAFVYPSLYEGFGLPPLEAMQCGVPVIASRSSSLPEVVGDAGVLVDPTDTDALAQAIRDVALDEGLRERMRRRSLARAACFTWERTTRLTVDAYRAALEA